MTEMMKKARQGRESALLGKSMQKQSKPRPMQVLLHAPAPRGPAEAVKNSNTTQPHVLTKKDMVKLPVAQAV